MSPKRVPKLPRQTIYMDERGRIVVPEYMREALGLEIPCWVEIERYPIEGECKTIFLKKNSFFTPREPEAEKSNSLSTAESGRDA